MKLCSIKISKFFIIINWIKYIEYKKTIIHWWIYKLDLDSKTKYTPYDTTSFIWKQINASGHFHIYNIIYGRPTIPSNETRHVNKIKLKYTARWEVKSNEICKNQTRCISEDYILHCRRYSNYHYNNPSKIKYLQFHHSHYSQLD